MKYGPKASKFKAGGVWHVKLKHGIAEEIYHCESETAAKALVKKLNKKFRKST